MKPYLILLSILILVGCKQKPKSNKDTLINNTIYEEQAEIDSSLIKKKQADSLSYLLSVKAEVNIKSLEIIEYKGIGEKAKKTVITLDSLIVREEPTAYNSSNSLLYQKSDPYLLTVLSSVIQNKFSENIDFSEEPGYYSNAGGSFVRVKVSFKNDLKTELTFENCKTKTLKKAVRILNKELPKDHRIILPLKTIVDLTLPPDSLKTWKKLKAVAKYNNKSGFKISDFDRSELIRLDSTIFGKKIHETYWLKSSYIIAVKPNIGAFYPCVIYGQQWDCDELSNFLAVCMLDSLLTQKGDFKFIAANWSDFDGDGYYSSVISDSVIKTTTSYSFENLDEEFARVDGLKSYETVEKILMTGDGKITSIKKDSMNMKYFDVENKERILQ
jgi:hypothetical protein